MQIGTSIFLIALGAILRYAVETTTSGFNIHTAGLILMVVGVIGLAISVLLMLTATGRRGTVVRERPAYVEREREI